MPPCLRALIGILLISVAASALPPSTASTQPLPPDVEALVTQLSAPSFRAREQAQRRLAQVGQDYLAQLQQLSQQSPDPETRHGLALVLEKIELQAAIAPARITLHVKDAPAKTVFEDIARQAGVQPFPTVPEALWEDEDLPKVTVDLDHRPFWEAIREVGMQTRVELTTPWDGRQLILHKQLAGKPWMGGFTAVSGSFLVVGKWEGTPQDGQCVMRLKFQAEPKFRFSSGSPYLKLEGADDKGNPIASAKMPEDLNPRSSAAWNMESRFTIPADPGKKLTRCGGTASFRIEPRGSRIEFADLNSTDFASKSSGKYQVTYRGMPAAGDEAAFYVAVIVSTGDPIYQQMDLITDSGRWQLFDQRGRSSQGQPSSTSGTGDGTLEMTLRFPRLDAAAKPTKLVWEVPSEPRAVSVPVEFKDIPLPGS